MDDISAELGKSRCHPQSLIWLLPSFAAAGLFIFPPFTPRLLSLFLSLSLHHTPSLLLSRFGANADGGAIDLITKKKVLPIFFFCPNHEDVTLRDPDCGNDGMNRRKGGVDVGVGVCGCAQVIHLGLYHHYLARGHMHNLIHRALSPFRREERGKEGGAKGSRIEIQQKGINISPHCSIVLISLGPAEGALINAIELLNGCFSAQKEDILIISADARIQTRHRLGLLFSNVCIILLSSLLDMTINAYGHYLLDVR